MPIDVSTIFERGGRELIDLLEYSVLSTKTDLVFAFLVREYRLLPTAAGAVALHDMFCSAVAPAKIGPNGLLSLRSMRFDQTIMRYRADSPTMIDAVDPEGGQAGDGGSEESSVDRTQVDTPPSYLFDSIVREISAGDNTVIAAVQLGYDPSITPQENLPGGRLTDGQRAFVNNVWLPIVRPNLVAAGFWRIATVA